MSDAPAKGRSIQRVSSLDSSPRTGSIASFLHRSRILEGAAKVFATRGARQVSVEDLLEASSVSRRTFYKYFRSKEDVLEALHAVSVQYLLDRTRQALDEASGLPRKLECFVDTYLSFNRTDLELFRVLQAEALRPDSPLAPTRARVVDALAELLTDEVQAVHGHRPDRFVMLGLLSGLTGVSVQLHAQGKVTPAQCARARLAMLRILQAGLAPEGGPVPPLPLEPPRSRSTRAARPAPRKRRGS
jgi:AcrR family transcriptional regulator